MGIFKRTRDHGITSMDSQTPAIEMKTRNSHDPLSNSTNQQVLPVHKVNHNGHKVTKGVHPDGESGRSWFHPWHFVRICWHSTSNASCLVNILWPVVPAAIAVYYTHQDTRLVFALNYVAMVPCANLVGFAGQELARKLPKVFGVLLETTLGSVIEIILFMVLLRNNDFAVIQAAILGSILATLLLCLGMCFFVGGLRREEQQFDGSVAEVGNGLLLTAGLALVVPAAFYHALSGQNVTTAALGEKVLHISRITSILLIVAYIFYVWFQMHSHHSIYNAIFERDELQDADRHKDLRKDKLTFTECIVALAIGITLATIVAISLVHEIEPLVTEYGVSDSGMGLILVPLVEKFAEHLTAVDEAWDNTMNLALAHVLGATIQTSLFNAPLVVIVAWGLGKDLDLNFDLFNIIVVILAIIVVGNFLKDQKSNYLEGALCVIVYVIIAVAAFYYPNLLTDASGAEPANEGGQAARRWQGA